MTNIQQTLIKAQKRLIDLHFKAKAGHVGGGLSCLDTLVVLHHQIMKPGDRFVLSKGHAAGALYVTLWSLGLLTDEQLNTFGQDNTTLPGHPSGQGIPNLLFPTGSLGHGPSLAAGLALAGQYRQSQHRVYCLCSDGEWQEGSCWEALIFAAHHRLDNLTIMIDRNGLQGFGTTDEVASFNNWPARFQSFGAEVETIDGHDLEAITKALAHKAVSMPLVIILETKKGKGLAYENKLESHYLPICDDDYERACQTLNSGGRL